MKVDSRFSLKRGNSEQKLFRSTCAVPIKNIRDVTLHSVRVKNYIFVDKYGGPKLKGHFLRFQK